MNNKDIGRVGEDLASDFLKQKDYEIICRNWTCYAGEIDIVAIKDRLTFVEVKNSGGFCFAYELFGKRKKQHLLRTIGIFMSQLKVQKLDYQIDLICIDNNEGVSRISHYENLEI